MVEDQEILKLETGTKEAKKLEPKKVKIEKVSVESVGDKGNKKVVCSVKHPDREELINISSVKYERMGKLESVGLWVNKDEDGLIRKGSALATLIAHCAVKVPQELEGREVDTAEDENGYLCFKAY